jgi:hypothetical protein
LVSFQIKRLKRRGARRGLTLGLPTEILHLGSARLHLTVNLGI